MGKDLEDYTLQQVIDRVRERRQQTHHGDRVPAGYDVRRPSVQLVEVDADE